MPHTAAVELICKDSGTHFDPAIVESFLRIEKRFLEISAQYSD